MKKVGLLLITLCLVALTQAQKYELSCSKSEMGIRWPSYESNSEYYICPRLFGKQLTVTCDPGQVFTFVLQSCTYPSRYIPAPGLDVLPTAAPLTSKPNKDGYLTPLEISNIGHPPILKPSVLDMPAQPQPPVQPQLQLQLQPQVKPIELSQPPVALVETSKLEEIKPAKKEEPLAVVDSAPLPPTPAPTPPVVEKPTVAAGKKPAPSKKKTSSKPSKNAKKSKNDKKTTKTEKAPKKSAKKSEKKKTKNNKPVN
ncbi:uncharacterized protein ACRADG_001016 [Cochliomyia hominivorax]